MTLLEENESVFKKATLSEIKEGDTEVI